MVSGPPSHSRTPSDSLPRSERTATSTIHEATFRDGRGRLARERERALAREREKERERKEGGGEGVRACLMPRPAVFGVHLAQLDRLDGRTVIAAPCTQSPCLRLPKPPKVRGRLPIITHQKLKSYA